MSGLRALLFSSIALAIACDEPHPLPGDELIGTYVFQATRIDAGCEGFSELQAPGFPFSGTFSRCLPDSTSPLCEGAPGRTFFTREDVDRDAGFDGQVIDVYPISIPVQLAQCPTERLRLVDGLQVALFSASQSAELGTTFVCPPDALDGGVPAPDGGVLAPGPGPNGFDAPFACGQLVNRILNDDFDGGSGVCRTDAGVPLLPTGACVVYYRLQGVRQ